MDAYKALEIAEHQLYHAVLAYEFNRKRKGVTEKEVQTLADKITYCRYVQRLLLDRCQKLDSPFL